MTKKYLPTELIDRHLAERRVAKAARAMIRAAGFKPPMKIPGEPVPLPANPTHEDLAAFMGISPAKLEEELGMRFERLAEMLKTDRSELAELLAATVKVSSRPKSPAEADALRVAVAKLRLYGVETVRKITVAKLNRAKALARHRQQARKCGR